LEIFNQIWFCAQLLHVTQIFNALALPTGVNEHCGDWPMYVRANHNFFDHPCYSSVVIQVERIDFVEEITWYGQF
jgi:hypothetical protein